MSAARHLLVAARRLHDARAIHDAAKSDPTRNVATGLALVDAQRAFDQALTAWNSHERTARRP